MPQPESPTSADPSSTDDNKAHPRVSILGGALATGVAMVLRQGAALIVTVLVARILGPAGKGELSLLSQYAGVAALIVSLGFEGAHSYFVGRRGRPAEQVVSDSIAFVATMSIVAVPALFVFMRLYVPALDAVGAATIAVAAATLTPMLFLSLMGGVLVGQGRVKAQALATSVASAVPLALILVAAVLGRLTVSVALVASMTGLVAAALVAAASTKTRRLPAPSWVRLRDEAEYAWKSYVQNVAGYLELRQDILLLGFLSTSAAVGVYATGVSLAELIYLVPQTVLVALTARALQEDHKGGADITVRVTRLLMTFSALFTLALLLVVQPLVRLAFGPEFEESALVFLLLIPGVLSWALSSQVQAFLATHGRLFPILGVTMLVSNLALNLVLIPRYGVVGAAIATSISYCAGNGYVVAVFLRSTGTRLRELLLIDREDVALIRTSIRSRLAGRS